jgi:hypothetical protein
VKKSVSWGLISQQVPALDLIFGWDYPLSCVETADFKVVMNAYFCFRS